MKFKVKFFVLADTILLDTAGKASIIGIFDRIFVSNYPSVHSRFDIATIIEGENGEHTQKLVVKSPKDEILIETPTITFKIDDSNKKAQFINPFQNIPIPEKGTYKIEVVVDGEPIDTETFEVAPQPL
jgi:hypothetical protein